MDVAAVPELKPSELAERLRVSELGGRDEKGHAEPRHEGVSVYHDCSPTEFSVNMSSLAVARSVLGRGCHQGLQYNIQRKPAPGSKIRI